MISMVFAIALTAQEPGGAVLARIAPVQAAIDAEVARQAALPPPRTDAERLDRMGAMDQVGRRALIPVDFSDLPEPERQVANDALWAPVTAMDHRLTAKLLKMVPRKGWFLKSMVGRGPAPPS